MDAAKIIANIKSQALVGNTAAIGDDDRVLRYLNKAYTKVYGKLAQANPSLYQKFQTVTITAGTGALTYSAFTILSAYDLTSKRLLTKRTLGNIEEEEPGLDRTGQAETYDPTIGGLYTYPISDTTLQLRYVPNPAELTANSLEADILIPPVFHEVLEWATLWTLAYDERDKLVGSELQFTDREFNDGLSSLLQWAFAQRPAEERRVQPSW